MIRSGTARSGPGHDGRRRLRRWLGRWSFFRRHDRDRIEPSERAPAPRPTPVPKQLPDEAFECVRGGSLLSFPCSPEIEDPDFRGLVLAAPRTVRFTPGAHDPIQGTFAPVVVCGTYALEETMEDPVESIAFFAVDEARSEVFSGRMVTVQNRVPCPPHVQADLDAVRADLESYAVTGYFNPNLAHVLRLPERPARYVVYALLGPFASNRVVISVEEAVEVR